MNGKFECMRCGSCCLRAGPVLHVVQNDVDRWTRDGREDILSKLFLVRFVCKHCDLEWVCHMGNKCPKCANQSKEGIYYWLDPKFSDTWFAQLMGNPRCPFLKKVRKKDGYACLINETKPEICQGFPELKVEEVTQNEEECIEWGCRGYLKWKKE